MPHDAEERGRPPAPSTPPETNFEVRLHRKAAKALKELDRGTRSRVVDALHGLEADPFRPRPGADIKKLHGTKGRADAYRLRVGNLRVVYEIDTGERVVLVTFILPRKIAYGWLE